MRDAPNISESP